MKYQDVIIKRKPFDINLVMTMKQELEDLKNYYPYSGFIEAALGEMDIRLRDIRGPSSGITNELIYRRHLRGAANIDITSGYYHHYRFHYYYYYYYIKDHLDITRMRHNSVLGVI